MFIVNNLNTHTSDIEPVPFKCDCPSLPPQPPKVEPPVVTKLEPPAVARVEIPIVPKIEAPAPPKTDATTSTQTTPPLPPCTPVSQDSPVQRAIIIYYPHHQSDYFFPEVRWYV
jgi:hypothetical protein